MENEDNKGGLISRLFTSEAIEEYKAVRDYNDTHNAFDMTKQIDLGGELSWLDTIKLNFQDTLDKFLTFKMEFKEAIHEQRTGEIVSFHPNDSDGKTPHVVCNQNAFAPD